MRLAELVGTLSLAADSGTGMPDETGLRTATMAAKIGTLLDATAAERSSALYLSMLRFVGCTADSQRPAAAFGDELAFGSHSQGTDYGDMREFMAAMVRFRSAGRGVVGGTVAVVQTLAKLMGMQDHGREHCEAADLLAGGLGFDAAFRKALVHNGERWDGTGAPDKVRGDAIARIARIAQAAYESEIGYRFGGVDGIRERLGRLRSRCLDPAIVDRILGSVDELARTMAVPSAWQAMLDAEPAPHREVTGEALEEALSTIAMFADLKSAYTRGHSAAVAELAAAAARSEGLPAEIVDDVRHAGLLHDLGRVAISGGIWDNPGPLTDVEREKIRMHSYVGERLLSRAPALARISEITSLAHERLDGSGYHRRVAAAAVPPQARILAVADVYQALIEDRPHRKAFSPEGAVAELTAMVEAGALCPEATRAVLAAAGHTPPKLDRVAGLTSRQVEVLRLLARGLTNKEIANALDISAKTAGHHVQHIFEKLGVTTRSGAAIHAMRFGITP